MVDKLGEIIESDDDIIAVRDNDGGKLLGKEIETATVGIDRNTLLKCGAAASLDWVADEIAEQIEAYIELYNRDGVGPSDTDITYSTYELLRMMRRIDNDRAEKLREKVDNAVL